MSKYQIIGSMTGNSMDAVDLVLTSFDDDHMEDICAYSMDFSDQMREKMEYLRRVCKAKTRDEIVKLPFFDEIHDEYVKCVYQATQKMLELYQIEPSTVDAFAFHGKTLDHFPPSLAQKANLAPYTLQIGSGQMLSDLLQIPVVYDFRSPYIQAGLEGAPLVPPHNAHIALVEGDGIYYNGGNTSNFAWISGGKCVAAADAGPFNEFIDGWIRRFCSEPFDQNGKYGRKGHLDTNLLQKLFDAGRDFYQRSIPKSGDPQYYDRDQIFEMILQHIPKYEFCDVAHTFEYFAAYIAFQALTLTNQALADAEQILLFGGGWKNPVVFESFKTLLEAKGFVLPEHQEKFGAFLKRFEKIPQIKYSVFGQNMEARLFADMARYKLENKVWELPEVIKSGQKIVSGKIAFPQKNQTEYDDKINEAACGWQNCIKSLEIS